MQLASPLKGFKKIVRMKEVFTLLIASFVVAVAEWIFLFIKVKPQPDYIPLHYTITFGIDRIGPWYSAYLLPLSGTIMWCINVGLASLTIEHQRVTTMFIALLSLFIQCILLVAAFLIFKSL